MALLPLRTHLRENVTLALPVMISNIGHVMMGVCDNVMVGHIDTVSLAAAGLATVAFNVLFLFGIGVSYAITPLVASAHGEHDDERITQTLRHGLLINVCNAVVLLMMVLIGKNLLYHINQPEEVVTRAIPYLNIICVSLIPALIFQSFKQFAEGLSNTRLAMIVVLSTNIINIGLNYVLIFGHLGFPSLGLNGAGYATLISRTIMAIAIAVYIYKKPSFKRYRNAFIPRKYSRVVFKKMLQLGIPSGLQFIFEVAAFDFSLVMMGWLGIYQQASHQVVINLATLSYMTTAGLAAAATIRVGYFLGLRDTANLRRAGFSLLGMALILMSVWAIFFVFGRHWIPTLYTNDVKVINVASGLLIIAGLFQLADGTQVVCASALRGLQDVKIPSVFIFVSYWVIGLPLGYYLGFKTPLEAMGVWIGLLIGLTLTALAMFFRFQKLSKTVG